MGIHVAVPVLVVCLSFLFNAVPVISQESRLGKATSEQSFTLRGHEIPYFFVIRHFFNYLCLISKEKDQGYESYLQERMGIAPGSPAAAAVMKAIKTAEPILAMKTIDMSLIDDPAAFGEFQYEALKSMADGLYAVYVELLEDLVMHGYSREQFRQFVDRWVRPGTTVTSIGRPLDDRYLAAIGIFERMKKP